MIVSVLCLIFTLGFNNAEKPCAPRQIPGQSVVCVCNSTYCDEIVREVPASGTFVTYTSSEQGSRFLKQTHALKYSNIESHHYTIQLDPSFQYQTIEGFGGAVTDSAAINWKNLSQPLQAYLIRSYFSDEGLEYNMLRLPIGGSDFSVRGYAYNEYPANDTKLSNFTLENEDINFKIPMIKEIFKAATADVHIVSTTWSPPTWMKSDHSYVGSNHLLREHYQTYADYHIKFLENYAKRGVPIWAITTTNEPTNGFLFNSIINCLGWSPRNMGKWISQNLGPTIRKSNFKDVKILAVDDQRHIIPVMFNLKYFMKSQSFSKPACSVFGSEVFSHIVTYDQMLKVNPGAKQYIDGIAVHYYTDFLTPTAILREIARDYPDKFVLGTEACTGSLPWDKNKVEVGSWKRAVSYIVDIISDLNNNLVGWIDWNLCLNKKGGPNWVKNFVDAPIIVYPEKNEFIKQPMFYAMGHFSKFIPRGSRRISSESKCVSESESCTEKIKNIAFVTPNNTVVVVVYNPGSSTTVCLVLEERQAIMELEANSVVTAEIPYESNYYN